MKGLADLSRTPVDLRWPVARQSDASCWSQLQDRASPKIGEQTALYIVHEVNQPLAAILIEAQTALNWLTGDPPKLDEVRHAIENLVQYSHRAADVVRNVRDLVRMSPQIVANLDLNDVVRYAIDFSGPDLARHGITLESELSPTLPPIKGDPVQIELLVGNLIANGIEAMSALDGPERMLRITTGLDRADNVLVTVKDSGPGLDQVGFERVFEPFVTTKRGGMGLGLAICRSIVHSHGGRLWAAGNTPHGSIFSFTVPIA